MKIRSLFFVFFFINSIDAKIYEINDQHSFVNFEVDYMMVSKVKGTFDKFKGTFDFDEDKKMISNIDFIIDASSLNTRDQKRDRHLKQKDFFYISKYPNIIFKAKQFAIDSNTKKIKGIFTLRGIRKEIEIELSWKGLRTDPIDKKRRSLFFSVSGVLNRKEFGITWNKSLDAGGVMVGENVQYEIIVEANPTDQKAPFSRFRK